MADERETMNVNEQAQSAESTDRGLFDFMKKKEDEKPQDHQEKFSSEFDQKVHVSEPHHVEYTNKVQDEETTPKEEDEKKKHGGILDKLHRSDSSSSSSSDEEDDEEKKKKKKKKENKGLKEKVKEKLPGHKVDEDTNVPIEMKHDEKPHVQEVAYTEPSHPVEDPEKKGFLDKMKDKLPGKKADEHHDAVAAPAAPVVAEPVAEGEKKGLLEKIKDKIPGFHPKSETEEKKESH